MRGVFSTLVAVVLLSSARSDANELQSNTSTSNFKAYPSCGMQGIPRTNGIPVIPGASGSPGRDGFKGEKSTTGKRGMQGPIETPGKMGPRGFEGPKGETGENGTTGVKRSAGIPGIPGLRGLNRPKGKKGEIGPMGIKGSTGIPGNSGPRGAKGDKGDAATIDPRWLANWKQCAWKEGTDTDNRKNKGCFRLFQLHSNTALKVSNQGTIRVYSQQACNDGILSLTAMNAVVL